MSDPGFLRRLTLFGAGAAVLGFFVFQLGRAARLSGDPDRFYHLFLARDWARSPGLFQTSVPAVEGLGWGEFFPDKEPLFHLLGGLLHAVGGEPAVLLIPPLMGLLLVLVLCSLLGKGLDRLSPAASCLLIAGSLLVHPYFFGRMAMLRPHTLAVVVFFALLHSVAAGRRWLAFVLAGVFALAYHAIQLPLLLLAFDAGARVWEGRRSGRSFRFETLTVPLFGFAGIVAGVLASPSFPGNIAMTVRVLRIALFEASTGALKFGVELYPWSTAVFLRAHLATPVLLLLAGREVFRDRARDRRLLLAFILSPAFLALSMQSPRAQEYLIPLLVLLATMLIARMWRERKTGQAALLVALLALPAVSAGERSLGLNVPEPGEPPGNSEWIRALRGLPEAAPRIFNMEWDSTPPILYARSDARVLDLLDPSLLVAESSDLHRQREAILAGDIVDVRGYVSSVFRADYLTTRDLSLRGRLERDPHFERVFPKRGSKYSGAEALFRVSSRARKNFLDRFAEIRGAAGLTIEESSRLRPGSSELRRLEPAKPRANHGAASTEVPAYVDLMPWFSKSDEKSRSQETGEPRIRCTWLVPLASESVKWKGRRFLAIGGGKNVRVWMNGRPLYHSVVMSTAPQLVHQLVDPGRTFDSNDRFDFLVCSSEDGPVLGLAASFWGETELDELCRRKDWSPPESLKDERDWAMVGRPRTSCLGDFAMPSLQRR